MYYVEVTEENGLFKENDWTTTRMNTLEDEDSMCVCVCV